MKKFVITALLAILLISPGIVNAQTTTPVPTRTPRGQQVRQEVKQRIVAEKEERLQALTEKRRGLIREFFQRMLRRFEAMIDRLERLVQRIEARMDKIGDVDKTDLNRAKAKLADTQADIDALKADFEEMLTSDTPKEVFKDLGQEVRNIKKQLVEIHRLLVSIIGDLKGLRVGDEE